MKTDLTLWLKKEQLIIDKVITDAARDYYHVHKHARNFSHDLKVCHLESYNLVKGKDLCYDRPNTAFAYSLWYHPRRINTFLSFFRDKILEQEVGHIEVFDLGAGTGAIQWSLGLICAGILGLGGTPPKITVVNIDTSPFMLDYNRCYLWKHFTASYPEIDGYITAEYQVNSWNNSRRLETSNLILAASYLFDASDNKTEIESDFNSMVSSMNPKSVLLLTSNQKEKVLFLKSLEAGFAAKGYNTSTVSQSGLIFDLPLSHVNLMREDLGQHYGISELKRTASWYDSSYYALIADRSQIDLSIPEKAPSHESISIYNPPMSIRRDVGLNEKQIRAAKQTDLPTIIMGPAGSGKSIVLTEKLRNIVEGCQYAPNLRILVTTFNKGMVGKLGEWLEQILDSSKCKYQRFRDQTGVILFSGSNVPNIRLLHFDMLPKVIGDVKYHGNVNREQHYALLKEIVENVKQENGIVDDQYDNVLNAIFLYEEYNRVIYGLGVGITGGEGTYLGITRKGRGNNPSLPKYSDRRLFVWKCLHAYAYKMHRNNIQNFSLRRQYLLSKLHSDPTVAKYDHILLDEFQDCTQTDYEILFSLIKDPNMLTIAGDISQSIHLGTVAKIPRNDKMNRRQIHRLDGSYRLPMRISACIKQLSDVIVQRHNNAEGVSNISPHRCSPPGSRPIVVYGSDYSEVAKKVQEIYDVYKIFDIESITILEKDEQLRDEIRKAGIQCDTESILWVKGLERECVLWSTRVELDRTNELLEYVYTILTRSSCLLIISVTKDTHFQYRKILGLLDSERIILWDQETEDEYIKYCDSYQPEVVVDEDTD
jgi:DNA helicase-2/ATP-dependent DNA helicase PcrA